MELFCGIARCFFSLQKSRTAVMKRLQNGKNIMKGKNLFLNFCFFDFDACEKEKMFLLLSCK
ncbi:hypothetical protein B5G09_01595 [Alistipes sp. An54]|nr:hypothetical protein B5G09_01595 [Alistipes sp. An54]